MIKTYAKTTDMVCLKPGDIVEAGDCYSPGAIWGHRGRKFHSEKPDMGKNKP